MSDMISRADIDYHIDIEEPPQCNVLKALEFMHSDSLTLDFHQCAALTYAHTAHFLHMSRLRSEVVKSAAFLIRTLAREAVASRPSAESAGALSDTDRPFLTAWDAIAVLTLLGDPENTLAAVSLTDWYLRCVSLLWKAARLTD